MALIIKKEIIGDYTVRIIQHPISKGSYLYVTLILCNKTVFKSMEFTSKLTAVSMFKKTLQAVLKHKVRQNLRQLKI